MRTDVVFHFIIVLDMWVWLSLCVLKSIEFQVNRAPILSICFMKALFPYLYPQANVLYFEVFPGFICELHVIYSYSHTRISFHVFQVNLGIICVIHLWALFNLLWRLWNHCIPNLTLLYGLGMYVHKQSSSYILPFFKYSALVLS